MNISLGHKRLDCTPWGLPLMLGSEDTLGWWQHRCDASSMCLGDKLQNMAISQDLTINHWSTESNEHDAYWPLCVALGARQWVDDFADGEGQERMPRGTETRWRHPGETASFRGVRGHLRFESLHLLVKQPFQAGRLQVVLFPGANLSYCLHRWTPRFKVPESVGHTVENFGMTENQNFCIFQVYHCFSLTFELISWISVDTCGN